jgi:hypothetical protein
MSDDTKPNGSSKGSRSGTVKPRASQVGYNSPRSKFSLMGNTPANGRRSSTHRPNSIAPDTFARIQREALTSPPEIVETQGETICKVKEELTTLSEDSNHILYRCPLREEGEEEYPESDKQKSSGSPDLEQIQNSGSRGGNKEDHSRGLKDDE